MHDSERYGYLQINGKPIPDEHVARRCGTDLQAYLALIAELDSVGLLNRTRDSIIFDPEMIDQEKSRSDNAKRQKQFQDRKRAETAGVKPNERKKGETEKNEKGITGQNPPKTYNGDITPDITPNKRAISSSTSNSNSRELNGSSQQSSKSRAREPAAAADSSNSSVKPRQWLELTAEEKAMSQADFTKHLQSLHPTKNVKQIAAKLRQWCVENPGKDFSKERLKGWVAGETEEMTDEEFLTAIDGEIEKGVKSGKTDQATKNRVDLSRFNSPQFD